MSPNALGRTPFEPYTGPEQSDFIAPTPGTIVLPGGTPQARMSPGGQGQPMLANLEARSTRSSEGVPHEFEPNRAFRAWSPPPTSTGQRTPTPFGSPARQITHSEATQWDALAVADPSPPPFHQPSPTGGQRNPFSFNRDVAIASPIAQWALTAQGDGPARTPLIAQPSHHAAPPQGDWQVDAAHQQPVVAFDYVGLGNNPEQFVLEQHQAHAMHAHGPNMGQLAFEPGIAAYDYNDLDLQHMLFGGGREDAALPAPEGWPIDWAAQQPAVAHGNVDHWAPDRRMRIDRVLNPPAPSVNGNRSITPEPALEPGFPTHIYINLPNEERGLQLGPARCDNPQPPEHLTAKIMRESIPYRALARSNVLTPTGQVLHELSYSAWMGSEMRLLAPQAADLRIAVIHDGANVIQYQYQWGENQRFFADFYTPNDLVG